MKETAIIYCRKSTDREDRQQNSLEYQKGACFINLKNNNLEFYKGSEKHGYIEESASAKVKFKRSGFNRMVETIEKGGVDYIIADEPKRLSRNTIDSATIIDLLETGKLKGIITTGRKYEGQNTSDIFLLEIDLGISKKDNKDRGIDVKKKMITALHRGQWLSKAIFGYANTGPKGKKDIKVVESEAELVLKAFIMRSQNKTLQSIADFLAEKTKIKWTSERVSKMLTNTRYYGLQKFGGEEALLDSPGYRPIVSKELFDKVNSITKAREYNSNGDLPRYFINILKDTEGNNLYPYKTKGNIYYHGGAKTPYKINISQNKIFNEFEKHIDNYNFPKPFITLSKLTLKEYYKDRINRRENDLRENTKELNLTNDRLESLLDNLLDNNIDKVTYDLKKKQLEEKKTELEEKRKALKQGDDNIVEIIENLCELVENLGESYKNGDNAKKGKIIKAMQCELILDNKKQLTIKENKLFEIIKSLNFHDWYSHGELNPGFRRERAAS